MSSSQSPERPASAARRDAAPAEKSAAGWEPASALPVYQTDSTEREGKKSRLPKVRVREHGESGRMGFHPLHFLRITFLSSNRVSRAVNLLWPFVPAAIACRFVRLEETPSNHLVVFILTYIAMVPCANMIGFAGQELARKVPHVFGILTETMVGSIVEIVLFMVLLTKELYPVIQAAILGSILATMLLCLGLCFFAGGLRRDEQTFSDTVSETGSNLLLVAGFGLAVPAIFANAPLTNRVQVDIAERALEISRITSILLIISYLVFIYFQARTHHGLYDNIFEADEARDRDGHRDKKKDKLTLTESIIALIISVGLVTLLAVILVEKIEPIVEDQGVSDAFMGLILVPLVEKAAEHLTAIDEAWDNQMNFALAHVLGATLQTALFNGPLVVLVGWGLGKGMSLDFELFDIAMLILSIIAVGNFLRDQKSNYLEGFLCVIVYIAIAVVAFKYPNPLHESHSEAAGNSTEGTTTTTPETGGH